ncbi:MAG TPA: site-2 protease family protein [Acidimicrobiia bacterium]|nr:site-2 protease family protein [Acidimicrobiia bacterium]
MGNSGFAVRFKLFRVPVTVHPAFFVILFLFGYLGAAEYILVWVAIGFASILIHEFGHALTARAFGSPARVELVSSGGVTYHNQMSDGRSLLVTLAGPATGIAIGLPLWLLVDETDYAGAVHAALVYGVWISLAWSLLNLLPILPLDGGNAVQSILQLTTGKPHVVTTRRISIVIAAAVAAFAASQGYIFGAFYAVTFIGINLSALRQHQERANAANPADLNAAQPVDRLQQTGAALLAKGEIDRGLAFITEGIERSGTIDKSVVDVVIATGSTEALATKLRHLPHPRGGSWEPVFRAALQQLGYDDKPGTFN